MRMFVVIAACVALTGCATTNANKISVCEHYKQAVALIDAYCQYISREVVLPPPSDEQPTTSDEVTPE